MPYNSLRSVRERKGVTVAQLAGKTSISIRTLQAYEMGERSILPDDLRKLSRVLIVSPGEILREPSEPPAPPAPPRPVLVAPAPAAPSRPVLVAPTPAAPQSLSVPTSSPEVAPRDVPFRRPPFAPAREPLVPTGEASGPSRPRIVRPPSPRRAPHPPGPATAGQIDQIRHLARRMGLEEAELPDRIGSPIEGLDHVGARAAIARLRKEMEESGVWQPRVGEGPDQEGEYLTKLRDHRVPIEVRLIDGGTIQGVVEDFTPYLIRVHQTDDRSDVFVRKLAIAYYRTQVPVDDFE